MEERIIRFGTDDYHRALELRDEVLRKPLGLKFTQEFLASEKYHYHLGIFQGERIVAVLLLEPLAESSVKMRQVAVAEACQGQGIGRRLVEFCEYFAREKNFKKIILHARKTAVSFYEKLNYTVSSDEFLEVGIPHFKMEKKLN